MARKRAHLPPDVHSLDDMSTRLRQGDTPSQRQIEQTLERGFGRLMALEADLQRRRSAPDAASDSEAAADVADLEEAVAALREALDALRKLSSPPGPPRIGYGFVLPPRRTGGPGDG
jgi:hypothetical protein